VNNNDSKLYFFAIPFIYGVIGLILSYINGVSLPGVHFMMGVICGYLALIAWKLWIKE
jgi:hypothetical protein